MIAKRLVILAFGVFLAAGAAEAQAQQPPVTVDLRVDNQPLIVLLERVARQCGRGLLVHRGAAELLAREVQLYAKDAPWAEAVRLLEQEYGIQLEYTEKRIEVRSTEVIFRERLQRRYYPSAVIMRSLENFPAERLGIESEGSEDTGASAFGFGDSEKSTPVIDDLPNLVLQGIGTNPSDLERGIEVLEDQGTLRVRHLPEAQSRVEDFLRGLERNAARQVVCRLYELPSVPERISYEKSEIPDLVKELPPRAVFIACDEQRNHYQGGVEFRHIATAEAVEETVDPVVRTLKDGLLIEVEPHVTGQGILANFQLQRCRILGAKEAKIDDGDGNPLTQLEQPRWTTDEIRDSRTVPVDGGVVLRLGDRAFLLTMEVK